MTSLYTFNKLEKLKSRKALDYLFKEGKAFLIHPFKVSYIIEQNTKGKINCGVGVSKRNFSKAVDRNRIKRLMREVYRLNKLPLHQVIAENDIMFFILFIDKKVPEKSIDLENKMQQVILKLVENYTHALDK